MHFILIAIVFALVAFSIRPLGWYMARVYMRRSVWLEKPLGWLEDGIYKLCGVRADEEMNWQEYALAIFLLGFFSTLLLFLIFILQHHLPLNPQQFDGLTVDLAFNAAVSFVTNTNWQSYSGESSLSYFSQCMGIVVQQFLSAATGMAVAVALFRALARKQTHLIGNAWVDIIRCVLYILMPLSCIFALILVSQGVIQNFADYTAYFPVDGNGASALIAQGPVASEVAIKMLGSNGGGFFNANGAHPFENPTMLSNLLQIASILLIPAALVYTFGCIVGDRRQAWSLLAAMLVVFIPLMVLGVWAESSGNPRFDAVIIDQSVGNIEGKEVRFGVATSALWAAATSTTSNGSVNAMHDSFTPLGGLVPLVLIQFGEVIFGGVGSGAYGMLVYVLLTVFIGGLMVGRTPEYLGKKLGALEIKMATLCIIIPAAAVLLGSALAVATEAGRAGIFNPGAQGFSEVLYALASASNNNGSAFAGLSANSPFYNILLAVAMILGRYGMIFPILMLAGSLAQKNKVPVSLGTLPTHTPLFIAMLVGSILMLGVLTYVPALALGPVAEHLHLHSIGSAP